MEATPRETPLTEIGTEKSACIRRQRYARRRGCSNSSLGVVPMGTGGHETPSKRWEREGLPPAVV
jgi:hypothetical protein